MFDNTDLYKSALVFITENLGHCCFDGCCCSASIKGVTLNSLKWSHRVHFFYSIIIQRLFKHVTITEPKAPIQMLIAIKSESERLIELCFGCSVRCVSILTSHIMILHLDVNVVVLETYMSINSIHFRMKQSEIMMKYVCFN